MRSSHGFHPRHVERLSAYWVETPGGPCIPIPMVTRPLSSGVKTGSMMRWIVGRSPASTRLRPDVGLASDGALNDYLAWATTTTMSRYHHSVNASRTASASNAGRETAFSSKDFRPFPTPTIVISGKTRRITSKGSSLTHPANNRRNSPPGRFTAFSHSRRNHRNPSGGCSHTSATVCRQARRINTLKCGLSIRFTAQNADSSVRSSPT